MKRYMGCDTKTDTNRYTQKKKPLSSSITLIIFCRFYVNRILTNYLAWFVIPKLFHLISCFHAIGQQYVVDKILIVKTHKQACKI